MNSLGDIIIKLENLRDNDKITDENNEQNNKNDVKRHYEYWIKFKDDYLSIYVK
ncbi:hypothetical protein [Spiroplasma endosymbiont of Phyllotreta cruciferae]|uniref:hypothetical protein n=1 Tax=Spiroplasma endosymbiont of Phyllotreta cruciferae TaxID=2886375 RepID=UPI00209F7054|nr:hypothetical protein [Spiroplasma endosymbiont of Phyllotreta cruciferae]